MKCECSHGLILLCSTASYSVYICANGYSADVHFSAQRQAQLQDDSAALEVREREMHQLEVSLVKSTYVYCCELLL